MSSKTSGITRNLILVVLAVCFGTNFQYYNNSVVSNLVTVGQEWFNGSHKENHGRYLDEGQMTLLWSFSSAAFQLGALCGSFSTGFLADRFGRRRALMLTGSLSCTGSAVVGVSKLAGLLELFVVGRALIGLAIGAGLSLVSMYISEIAPVRHRGSFGAVQQMLISFGNLCSYVTTLRGTLGDDQLWPVAAAVLPLAGALFQVLVLFFFAYDSPRYLVLAKHDSAKGLQALTFYQGSVGAEARLREIESEKHALPNNGSTSSDQKAGPLRPWHLFRSASLRRPLLLAILVITAISGGGVSAVLAHATMMLMQAGLDQFQSQMASIGLGIGSFLTPFLTVCLVERAGRKRLLLTGTAVTITSMLALTICMFGQHQFGWPGSSVGAVPCLYCSLIGSSLSFSVALIVCAELFPQTARATAMTLVFAYSWTWQCICVFAYPQLVEAVGVSFSYLPFICISFTCSVILARIMPETKGKTIEQISAMFQSSRSATVHPLPDEVMVKF